MGFASYRLYVSALVSLTALGMVPVSLFLAFGPRHEQQAPAPDASLVSTAAACVMFCDQPPMAAPTIAAPTTGKPLCTFYCDEPPLPSHDEVCRLFSGQKDC